MNSAFAPTGAIAGSVLPIRRAEELIATLPGVLSVRIVPSDAGAIDEVHVLTTDIVAPKQTVRNIESALIAQLGLRINHRKISIATTLDPNRASDSVPAAKASTAVLSSPTLEFAPAAAAAVATAATTALPYVSPVARGLSPSSIESKKAELLLAESRSAVKSEEVSGQVRLVFEDVELRRSRERGLTCRVTLSQGERKFVGESKGLASERARIELAARATVLAIEEAAAAESSRTRALTLEGSQVVQVFDRDLVFVNVSARDGRDNVRLTGTCEVHESAETSSVLAVLNATNRWMQLNR